MELRTWWDRWSNERVRRQCSVQVDMIGLIKMNELQRFRHMEWMESGRLVKKVYRSSVEEERRRGRPRARWEDKIKEYMEEGVVLAEDQQRWRSFCCGHPG